MRCGHSLPELIVAVALLGAGLAAVTSPAVLGARLLAEAVTRQQALEVAVDVLDSVAVSAVPMSGSQVDSVWDVRWHVEAAGAGLRVRVTVAERPAGPERARMEGPVLPRLPSVPDGPAMGVSTPVLQYPPARARSAGPGGPS